MARAPVIAREELFQLYVNQKFSVYEIAAIKSCSGQAIKAWLRKLNIPRRTSSERAIMACGKGAGFKRGRLNPAWGKSNKGSQIHGHFGIYKDIKFRSSYELKFAAWCDANKKKWSYEPKRFDLGDLTYCPDFLVDGEWTEIKGWITPRAVRAHELFRMHGHQLTVLFKADLIRMGVLKETYRSEEARVTTALYQRKYYLKNRDRLIACQKKSHSGET